MGQKVVKVDNFIYPSGNIYSGDMRGNKRHGFGTFTWIEDGSRYAGQWVNNQQSGKGTLFFANGNRFEGDFFKNNIHGVGTFDIKSGEQISGAFKFMRRIITTDGFKFPVSEYWLNVTIKSVSGRTIQYNGLATLHLFSGLFVLPNVQNPDLNNNYTQYSFYDAVIVLNPVDENESKEGNNSNLAVVNAVPVQNDYGSNQGVKFGEQDSTYGKEVRFENRPVNPFAHMF